MKVEGVHSVRKLIAQFARRLISIDGELLTEDIKYYPTQGNIL